MIHPSEIDGEVLRVLVVDLSRGSTEEGFESYTLYGRARYTGGRLVVMLDGNDDKGEALLVPESAWPRIRRVPDDADPAQFGGAGYTVGWLVRSRPRLS